MPTTSHDGIKLTLGPDNNIGDIITADSDGNQAWTSPVQGGNGSPLDNPPMSNIPSTYIDYDTNEVFVFDGTGWIGATGPYVTSPPSDGVAETTQVDQIIQITQTGYNNLTVIQSDTLYIIVN